MSAQTDDLVLQFDAACLHHVVGLVSVFGERAGKLRMIEAAACLKHIFDEQFGIVFDAVGLLKLRERHAHQAAAQRGVTAEGFHLFQHDDLLETKTLGFIASRQTGKTAAHNNHVELFVPTIHLSGSRCGLSNICRRCRSSSQTCAQKASPGNTVVLCHFLFSSGC